MRIINTVIIDDEASCIGTLENDLKNYKEVNVSASFTSAREALPFVRANIPNLLFLDMEMPGMNGLDFLRELSGQLHNKNICIVFYSGFDYKHEAIRHSAFDYLFKPYTLNELDIIINRVKDKLDTPNLDIHKLVEILTDNTGLIALNTDSGHIVVKSSQVVYFEYGGKELRVWKAILSDNTSYSLKYATKPEEILKISSDFCQTAQDHIVNIRYLFSLKNEGKKRYCVFYPPFDLLTIEITSKYYPGLKDKMNFL